MKINISYFTTVGKYRNSNQDAILITKDIISKKNTQLKYENKSFKITPKTEKIFAISDGMGGLEAGNIASNIILKTLKKYINNIYIDTLNDLLQKISENLNTFSKNNNISSLGGTLSFIKFENKKCKVFNIGDTRIYKLNNDILELLSIDHSLAYKAFLEKRVSEDAIRFHPQKNILTSCLTNKILNTYNFYYKEIDINFGDTFFICSDGLWENFSNKELKRKLSYKRIGNSSRFLLKDKYDLTSDNLSGIIIKIEE